MTRRRARSPLPPGPLAGGLLAAVPAAASLLVWATGQLSAWLWEGRWLPCRATQVPAVVARLPAHFGDPRLAWPAADRRLLPSAPAIYLTGAVLCALAVLGIVVLRWAIAATSGRRHPGRPRATSHRPHRPPRPTGAHRPGWPTGARWATRRDLSPVLVRRPVPGRLVIGRCPAGLVATEQRHSVLVVGPTQSGKTSGLAVPAILEWQGPVVATSVKGDLAALTRPWRTRLGRCWVFDPTAGAGTGRTTPWSPLSESGTWSGAQRMASWLVESTPARSGMADAAFWYSAAAKLLAPLLLAAQLGAATMADVVRWNNRADFDEAAEILSRAAQVEAGVALFACAERDDRIRSSVTTTLETVLSPFEDPVVARSTAASVIDPDSLVRRGGTLYLCGPSFEQARLAGLFAALVSAVVAAAVEAANGAGGTLDPPLLLVLDEAANIAPIRDLDTLASTGAGLGIQLVTICQDLAQLTARYGEDRARSIANNHRAKLVLSGVSDLATLDLVSGLAGEQAVPQHTFTADLRDGRRTRSSAVTYRRLASADELRRTPPGEGVLVYGHLPATTVLMRPWFEDRQLTARTATAGRAGGTARRGGGTVQEAGDGL